MPRGYDEARGNHRKGLDEMRHRHVRSDPAQHFGFRRRHAPKFVKKKARKQRGDEVSQRQLSAGTGWVFQVCIDMCIDMCIGMCVDRCIDMCMDMCVDIFIDMCMDMCIDMCMDICMGMCIDMCVDMCVGM